MTQTVRPSAPPAPCALDRHRPLRAAGWQFWSVAAQEWQWVTGTVISHRGEQRLIEIRLDATGRSVIRPCGPVVAAPEMAQ